MKVTARSKRAALLAVVFLLGAGVATAVVQFPRSISHESYVYRTYRAMDGVTTAADGTAIWIGPYEQMVVVPQSGVDANNTYDVNCGFSASMTSEPTTFDEVLATTNTMDVYAMPSGHPCEWVRVDKVADDGTATTIDVQVVRLRR